jgi:hypothetical protein
VLKVKGTVLLYVAVSLLRSRRGRGVLWQLARGGGRRAAVRIASANASYLCKVSHFWRRGKVQANWGVILASFMMGADGGVSKHFVVGRLGDSDVAHYGPIQ